MLRVSLILLISITLFSCERSGLKEFKNGEVELSKTSFDTGDIKLSGEWEFYWKQLPYNTKNDFDSDLLTSKSLVRIPGQWTGGYFSRDGYDAKGYGTFRLKIALDSPASLSLKIQDCYTSVSIWCNGKKIGENSPIATSESGATPTLKPITVKLPKSKDLDLMLCVSDYNYRIGGGFRQPPVIGPSGQIQSANKYRALTATMGSTFLLTAALLVILIYIFGSRNSIFLIFGLFIIMGVIRVSSMDFNLVHHIFPETPFWLANNLRFTSIYLGFALATIYFRRLFPHEINRVVALVYTVICCFAALILLLLPSYESSFIFIPMQFIMLSMVLYAIYGFIRAAIKRRPFAIGSVIGMALFLLFWGYDVLIAQQMFQGEHLAFYGFLGFVVIQLGTLVSLYRNTEIRLHTLSRELDNADTELSAKQVDINSLVANSNVSLEYKSKLLEKLTEIKSYDEEELRSEIQNLRLELKTQVNREEKLAFGRDQLEITGARFRSDLKSSFPQLSKTEIEICSLIRAGMTNKEIAAFRTTTENAVRIAKLRVRKKMNLTKDDDLSEILLAI